MGYPSLASEFPNDNTAISGGAAWVCETLVGPASLRPAPALPEDAPSAPFEPVGSPAFVLYFDDEPCDGPVDVDASGPAPRVRAQPAPCDPPTVEPESPAFTHFESALTAALLAAGSTRAAALLPLLLRLQPLPVDALAKEAQLTLQSRGYLDDGGRYTPEYRELCGAWAAVLRGASQDLTACGTTTLDRFGAELLAALLALPKPRAEELRRGLRQSGIAAFGVLERAA